MPELAAHLERVAKELALSLPLMRPGGGELEAPIALWTSILAAALAACAREAQMSVHANALHDYYAAHGELDFAKYHRAALERAVGEKAAGARG